MKVISSSLKQENGLKLTDLSDEYDLNNDDEYEDLLNCKNEDDTVDQLEVLDITNFQYGKMELDSFDDSTSIKEELFNGAVADLVNSSNGDFEESNDEISVVPNKKNVKRKKQHSMSKLQLSVRTTPRHYAKMFEFFEANPGLATGQLQKIHYRKKWRELTNLLNAEGLGEKSTEKWQKTWSDYKLHLRKKISSLKQQNCTEDLSNQFTEQEERALTIVGLSLSEDSMIDAIHKRFNLPNESEDSSSHSAASNNAPTNNPIRSNNNKSKKYRYRQFVLRKKSNECREKTLKELTLLRRTLNNGLNRIGDNLQLLVNKIDKQSAIASQLADAAAALATTATTVAAILNVSNSNSNNLS